MYLIDNFIYPLNMLNKFYLIKCFTYIFYNIVYINNW